MTRYHVIPPKEWHCGQAAEFMRDADKAEAWAAHRYTPEEAVATSVWNSEEPFVGVADETRVLCLFGCARPSPISDVGMPWMLSTKFLPDHGVAFLRRNRDYITHLQTQYRKLENWVDVRNTDTVAWLKWLGFTIDDPEPYGIGKLPFHRFHMEGI